MAWGFGGVLFHRKELRVGLSDDDGEHSPRLSLGHPNPQHATAQPFYVRLISVPAGPRYIRVAILRS